MNRIILIGNGFDLAHGLKTSYKHFIDDYWTKKIKSIRTVPNINEMKYEDIANDITITMLPSFSLLLSNSFKNYKTFKREVDRNMGDIVFNNKFLKKITNHLSLFNWVDVEIEYNKLLHDSIQYNDIEKVNEGFLIIKKALEKYLHEIVKKNKQKYLNYKILNKIYSNFKLKDFTEKGVKIFIEEECQKFIQLQNFKNKLTSQYLSEKTIYLLDFFKSYSISYNSPHFKSEFYKLMLNEENNYFNLLPKQILFLNFNYTNIENEYYEYDFFENKTGGFKSEIGGIKKDVIHIHGELMNENNPMIFGYGDEIDDGYKMIEKTNDNRYLENVKSIKYLETDNYKNLLNFINSDNYQIFIFGHSCGISDRTLLNTLFEHENCVSIKFFYYKENGTDNYSDVVRNISRNFTNKAIMREKVVNKMYCAPLL